MYILIKKQPMVIFNSYTYLKNLVSFSIKPLDIYYK